jgi:hypothetical protein
LGHAVVAISSQDGPRGDAAGRCFETHAVLATQAAPWVVLWHCEALQNVIAREGSGQQLIGSLHLLLYML